MLNKTVIALHVLHLPIQDLGNTGKDSGPHTPQLHPFGMCYIPIHWGLSARVLPSVFLGLAALRSVPMWVLLFVCTVPSIFSLCSSQGFSQRLEGQCSFSPLLCAINITHWAFWEGFVFSQKRPWRRGILLQEMLEELVGVQGLAGTFRMMSSQATVQCLLIPLKNIIKLSKGLSHIMTTSWDTLNSLQIFPLSESVWKSLSYTQAVLTSLLHLHIPVSLPMAVWSHWFTLSHMLALDLSSCWKCENSQTVQAIFILSVRQQNNFCLCCDKHFLMFWLHSLLSNSRILELVLLTKELLSTSF